MPQSASNPPTLPGLILTAILNTCTACGGANVSPRVLLCRCALAYSSSLPVEVWPLAVQHAWTTLVLTAIPMLPSVWLVFLTPETPTVNHELGAKTGARVLTRGANRCFYMLKDHRSRAPKQKGGMRFDGKVPYPTIAIAIVQTLLP